MTSAAVVIGIDEYVTQPLTSAVNDAHAMRDALVRLGLVHAADVILLTAPREGGAGDPTRQGILDALYPFYRGERTVDRLFVCYSGHGLLAYADAARTLARTGLIPVDMSNLDSQGGLLIDLNSVLERFRLAGPQEQFFFIDACRDFAYDKHPDMSSNLGWTAVDSGPERAQAILFAVPPLGRALSESGGLGVMTRHVIDALDARGIALDYSDDLRKYVVSPESVSAYVKKRILEQVGTVPLWQRKYMLPSLQHGEPKTGPIRTLEEPPDAPLIVRVEPANAAPRTAVKLSQMGVDVYCWPPNGFGQPWPVKPRRYWLDATSEAGEPDPPQLQLDAREQREATVSIRQPGLGKLSRPVQQEAGPSAPHVATALGVIKKGLAQITVDSEEPTSVVDLEQLDPPYTRWSNPSELNETVAPGAYRVRMRLGPDIFSAAEFQVRPGERVEVTPTPGASPLMRDILSEGLGAVISEGVGRDKSAMLPTALPLIGVGLFDRAGELFERFGSATPRHDAEAFGMRPLSLVLAIDGNDWPQGIRQVLLSATAATGADDSFPIAPLPREFAGGRIGLAVVRAPARSFLLRVESPHFGSIKLATASLKRRVTVVVVTIRPDGSFDISQNLLRIPGESYDEPLPDMPYERMLRELHLGQKLYASGELLDRAARTADLMDLFYAKWTDPILSCMAYFSWMDAPAEAAPRDSQMPRIVADNLYHYFGDLPDARIIHALEHEMEGRVPLAERIAADEVPVLLRSAAALEHLLKGPPSGRLKSLMREVVPGQPWVVSWRAEAAPTVQNS